MTTLRCAASAVAAVVPALAAGCAPSSDPAASADAVEPSRAHNGLPLSLTIHGGTFRPAYGIDLGSGTADVVPSAYAVRLAAAGEASGARARISATSVDWLSNTLLSARLPAGIASGDYDLELVDPRGNVAVLARAFTSLGPDVSPPWLTISSPAEGEVVAAETEVAGLIIADDGAGVIRDLSCAISGPTGPVAQRRCVVPTEAHATSCPCSFVAPAAGNDIAVLDKLELRATATDSAGNTATMAVTLALAPRPAVVSVGPRLGPAAGGTSFAIQGDNFVDGAPGTQILMDGQPIETTYASAMLLRGTTPMHDAGDVQLSVRTGAAMVPAGGFSFFAAPIVRGISPTEGAASGGTRVTIAGNNFRGLTTITFRDAELKLIGYLGCPKVVSDTRIEGVAPAGIGAAWVGARDPIGGDSQRSTSYQFSDAIVGEGCPASDGGAGP